MNLQDTQIKYFPSESLVSQVAQNIIDTMVGMVSKNIASVIFLSGGSLIEVYKKMTELLSLDLNLMGLVVALVDERDVPYGHKDSNEQQIRETGLIDDLEKRGARFVGILPDADDQIGEDIEVGSREDFGDVKDKYKNLFLNSDETVGIFGVGANGHTAGIMPMKDESIFSDLFLGNNGSDDYLVSYKTNEVSSDDKFKSRSTLTAKAIMGLDEIILFAKGFSKKQILEEFVFSGDVVNNGSRAYNKNPSLLLKKNEKRLEIFTDQLLNKLKE